MIDSWLRSISDQIRSPRAAATVGICHGYAEGDVFPRGRAVLAACILEVGTVLRSRSILKDQLPHGCRREMLWLYLPFPIGVVPRQRLLWPVIDAGL